MTDVHLVASHSAAGTLRAAIHQHGLSGKVFCIMDALEFGPLSDGRARATFWRSLTVPGHSDAIPYQERDDAFAPWRELQTFVAAEQPQRLLVWASESGADYVLLRMACHWLATENVVLWQVPVPPAGDLHAVAVHPPAALASFASKAVVIPHAQMASMAQEYGRIAARPELLRECDAHGRLLFKPATAHDGFILSCCPNEWRPAAYAVGVAMGRSDPRNPLGEIFVASRLQHLIAAGFIEANGPRDTLRDYQIRKPAI